MLKKGKNKPSVSEETELTTHLLLFFVKHFNITNKYLKIF